MNQTILIVMPYFYPAPGGIEKHIFTLCQEMKAQANVRIVVVASNHTSNQRVIETIAGLKVYRLPRWLKIANTPVHPMWYFELKKIIRAEKPDVIYGHAPVPFMADMAALAAGHVPFVLGYHFPSMRKGHLVTDVPIWLYEKLILPITCRRATFITPSSEYVSQNFLKAYHRKIVTIAQGVDTTLYQPAPQQAVRGRILFVGNLATEVKGLTTLIEALAIARKIEPELHLVVVGNGDLPKYQAMVRQLKLDQFVTFAGHQEGETLARHFRQAAMFVLPSYIDNFPSVLLEAGASGLPVVASNVGGVSTIIEANVTGLLVPARQPQALAQALTKLYQQPELARQLSQALYSRVTAGFEWPDKAAETLRVLHQATRPQILQVAPWYPPSLGGLQNCVKEISHRLVNHGWRVHVFTAKPSNDFRPATGSESPQVHWFRRYIFANTPIMPGLLPGLWWAARRNRTIMHVHAAQAFVPEVVWLVSKLTGTPYIVHFHADVDPSGPFGRVLNLYKKHLLRRVMVDAQTVIVFTKEFQQRINQRYGPTVHTTIIPNGVDPVLLKQSHQNHSQPHILYVGRLNSEKRVHLLIEALAHLPKSVTLDIVGDGPLAADLANQARRLGLHNVIFHGSKTGQELHEFYRRASIFSLVSTGEGMPLTILDAMAAGVPVVAAKVRGITELLQSDGILIDDPTPTNLAAALSDLMKNEQRANDLSHSARLRATQYDWDALTGQIAELYTVGAGRNLK